MRRVILLVVVMAATLVVASGLALADIIVGDGGDNHLVGTNGNDDISGAAGNDDIFGLGGQDRLFGDSGHDEVRGGNGADRLHAGLGNDRLLGQDGKDFANAIDKQVNDVVICGPGKQDVAGFDDRDDLFGSGNEDRVSESCEFWYVAFGGVIGPVSSARASDSAIDLSSIDTHEEAEQAEAAGLLKQVK
jgi:Ca2+-binding RTX toxin-like protein